MTGFATLAGQLDAYHWSWDLKAVNARGLDIRLRVPDWIEGLDQPARAQLGKAMARGSVTLGLRISRDSATNAENLDPAGLARALKDLAAVQEAATAQGLTLAPMSAAEILRLRGVTSSSSDTADTAALAKALLAQLPQLLQAFNDMRVTEGRALQQILGGQLDEIADLTEQAAVLAEARRDDWAAKMKENLARVLDSAEGADPDRVAQELALITVKSDVTEEIDRLRAHVEAARALLAQKAGPIGRKLDFLAQEFNREANTLCSKAQASDLTRVGLDLKAAIDQMREQVQNVE
jgi:uncharacterized protein (TIGR00255 family)